MIDHTAWIRTTPTAFVLVLVLVVASSAYTVYRRRRATNIVLLQRAEDELHPLLADYTKYQSYTTRHAQYPRIRTFYHPHSHAEKHESIKNLPLLVFIHGIGGVLPQFAPILGSLNNIAPCFGIELPGFGRSAPRPTDYSAYTIEALACLWKTAIEDVCAKHGHRQVVLIGHSMGCSISALLCSEASPNERLRVNVVGMIAICPRANPPSPRQTKQLRRFLLIPSFVVNLLRKCDRWGGENSASVRRVVGDMGLNDPDLRRQQYQWNRQVSTDVLKRVSAGLLPQTDSRGGVRGGWPGQDVWHGITTPMLLIAGKADTVTSPREVVHIVHHLFGADFEHLSAVEDEAAHKAMILTNGLEPRTFQRDISSTTAGRGTKQVVSLIWLPAPASHALLYAHTTHRLVSALMESFLSKHVNTYLDFGFQLRLLTTSGKWDVKNLEKWKAVLPVSGPICTSESANGLFRALKTMREQDDEHSPRHFLPKWADKVYAVVDISHDAPVYDSKILDKGGVEYHKFPTVSKIPPTPIEVQDFCSLVDKLIVERDAKGQSNKAIGVHCHYGYNRTGFFLCAYLVLRKKYDLEQAVEEFKRAKPPGIRHEHFLDVLWLRYANGVYRASEKGSDRSFINLTHDIGNKIVRARKHRAGGDYSRTPPSTRDTPVTDPLARSLSYHDEGVLTDTDTR